MNDSTRHTPDTSPRSENQASQARRAGSHPTGVKIGLLGQLRAVDGAGYDLLPRGRKARAMLAILILDGPGPILRERFCQLLWSRRHREQARASLRQSIHELQESLSRAGVDILKVERGMLYLRREGLEIDIDRLAQPGGLDWVQAGGDIAQLTRTQLLDDLAGLDQAFDQWLDEQRRRTTRQVLVQAEAVLANLDDDSHAARARLAAAEYLIDLYPSHIAAGQILLAEHVARGERDNRLSHPRAGAVTHPVSATGAIERERIVRLGVLPFRALDPGAEDGLAAGMADEITAALSRFRWFFLVASPSLAVLAAETRDGSERWRKLDLDFLVEGTVRRVGERVRVSARLLDLAAGGEVVWANRFDRVGTDVLTLQDEIAAEMVAQIDPQLMLHEARRAGARRGTSLSAYEMVLGTVPALYKLEQASFIAAGAVLEAAVAQDPYHAGAYTWWAYWHVFMVGQGWAPDHVGGLVRAGEMAERAVALDPYDARALSIAGHVRDMQLLPTVASTDLHRRALALNPNLPLAWGFAGLAQSLIGNQREAIRLIGQALALSPFDPHGFYFEMLMMMPHLLLREYETAAELGRRAILLKPALSNSYKGLLSALGYLDRPDEVAAIRQRLSVLEPGYTLRDAAARSPMRGAADRALFLEGLRRGGLAE